jgi:hypothetical protein
VHPSAVVFDLLLGAVLRKHQSCSDHNTRHDTHATQHSTAQHSTTQHNRITWSVSNGQRIATAARNEGAANNSCLKASQISAAIALSLTVHSR